MGARSFPSFGKGRNVHISGSLCQSDLVPADTGSGVPLRHRQIISIPEPKVSRHRPFPKEGKDRAPGIRHRKTISIPEPTVSRHRPFPKEGKDRAPVEVVVVSGHRPFPKEGKDRAPVEVMEVSGHRPFPKEGKDRAPVEVVEVDGYRPFRKEGKDRAPGSHHRRMFVSLISCQPSLSLTGPCSSSAYQR